MDQRRHALPEPLRACQRMAHMVKPEFGTRAWWCVSPRAYHSLSKIADGHCFSAGSHSNGRPMPSRLCLLPRDGGSSTTVSRTSTNKPVTATLLPFP